MGFAWGGGREQRRSFLKRKGDRMGEKTIRLGVAGAGIAVRDLHWPALKALGERYQIVALAAESEESLKETGEVVGCRTFYNDFKEMIDAEQDNLDAVLVSLPIALLYEGAAYAAWAGLDVLCEKPLGQSLAEGRKFLTLPERAGVSIQILENFRYRDDLRRARALLDEGAIGTPFMIRVQSVMHNEPEAGGFAGTEWRQEGEYAGGPLLDNGVHHMAALHVLGGAVARISGAVRGASDDYDGVDSALFTLEFKNRVMGEYTFAYTAFEEEGQTAFFQARCYGTGGTLILTDGKIRRLTEVGEEEPETFPDFDNGYRNEFLDFYQHKTTGQPLRVTPREAFQDLNLVLTGLRAARDGRVLAVEGKD